MFNPSDDEFDPNAETEDELEVAGMHVLGDDDDADEDVVPSILVDKEADALVEGAEAILEAKEPKDGLAALEEAEQAYLKGETEDEDPDTVVLAVEEEEEG